MILQLTDDDIFGADTASPSNCPLARGLRRVLKCPVLVGTAYFYVNSAQFLCSQEMRQFTNAFDNHKRQVASYEIEVPYEPAKEANV